MVGNTLQLTATIQPEDAEANELTWSLDNEEIASVSDSGLVTGIAAGTAVESVSTSEGSFTDGWSGFGYKQLLQYQY